jgi:hypothetical protein
LRSLASCAFLPKLALHHHQCIAIFLRGGGEPLGLLSLLLSLSKAHVRVFQYHVLAFSMSLRLGEGGVLQHELGPRLAKCRALLMELPILAL